MSVQELSACPPEPETPREDLSWALERIASRAGALDSKPRFPSENLADLAAVGALRAPADGLVGEVRLVRAVAAADASTARILDGHLNGTERLALAAPEPLRSNELARIGESELLLGVWGADPTAKEGSPARLQEVEGRLVLRGVKTFCSGAGGVQRALVVAADGEGSRRLVYLDPTSHVSIDRDWYRASGLRSSESHRIEFRDTPVLALLGGAGELSREPHFSCDAIRTSATWAGLADCILNEALAALDPARLDPVQAHGVGRMRVAQSTIDRWLEHTATALATDAEHQLELPTLALECRIALYECALLIAAQAARVCGSRALIGATALDRARRDLDLFLLQHRLDPKVVSLGAGLLDSERA
ncbi:MAG TPA: acyl-CoA dehydrogenase family protein [Solirubrobacteraceae bacterium]|jgi:alkylation response protein AidB-like acyl-CoA dehydrogenase|nr:acyl-CoA dehydrogenase family protein [Solirubrobacteraceae bacterium]